MTKTSLHVYFILLLRCLLSTILAENTLSFDKTKVGLRGPILILKKNIELEKKLYIDHTAHFVKIKS